MADVAGHSGYELDHVAFGVPDVAAVTALLVGELGGRALAAGPGIEFAWWQWEFARGGVIEVLQPDGPPGGFLHRFLAARGPGIHHVTFKVPSLAGAAARMRSLGYAIHGYSDVVPSWQEFFLHPKQAQGIVVQLAESHPELDPQGVPEPAFPAAPPAAAATADVVGLRLSARSAERARHQWETALGGQCREEADLLEFHWPHSPLRVRVRIDPAAPEGPVAIELAGAGAHAPSSGLHPVLGTRFEMLNRVPTASQ